MSERISSEYRKARKPHKCNYCGQKIEQGERYYRYVGKYDGEIYIWLGHEKCEYIAGEIWDYCDPEEGMSDEDFHEGCRDVCQTFVCPDCEKWDAEFGGCHSEVSYCIDKLYELFQTKELYREKRDGYGYSYWKIRDKEKVENGQ